MEKKQKRRVPVVVMGAAFTLLVGSVTAVAAWKYMTPDKVAEVMEDKGLMRAFQSKDAIVMNESQICGDLKITLLGMVSGKDLSSYVTNTKEGENGDIVIKADKTYIVTAIENTNDTSKNNTMEQEESGINLTVSPLVKGLKPWQFNIYTMGGGCMAISENGIEYRITESDNIEIFADRGLYLAVTDGVPSADAYQYDENTGEITRNDSYQGVNVLFHLPIEQSKADKEAAEKYLKEIEETKNSSDHEEEAIAEDALVEKVCQWSGEEIEKNAVLLEELTQVLTPDAEGNITTSAFNIGNEGMRVGEGKYLVESYFKEHSVGDMFPIGSMGENEGEVYIETFTLNEDGTVTYKIYRYSEKE